MGVADCCEAVYAYVLAHGLIMGALATVWAHLPLSGCIIVKRQENCSRVCRCAIETLQSLFSLCVSAQIHHDSVYVEDTMTYNTRFIMCTHHGHCLPYIHRAILHRPITTEELDRRRPDAYRGHVCPLLRGEGNWPQHASGSVSDQLLYCSDALLTAVDYWFKGKPWLARHAALLEQLKAVGTPQQQGQALLELEGMLHEAGWFVEGWAEHGRGAWRESVQACDNGNALVLRMATLQVLGRVAYVCIDDLQYHDVHSF